MEEITKLREKLIIAYFVNKKTKQAMWITTPILFIVGIFFFKIISDYNPINFTVCCLSSLGAGLLVARVSAISIIDSQMTDFSSNKKIDHIYNDKKKEFDQLSKERDDLKNILSNTGAGEDLEFNDSRKNLQKIRRKICLLSFEINLFDKKAE